MKRKINATAALLAAAAVLTAGMPSAAQAAGTDQVLVKLKPGHDAKSLAAKHGATHARELVAGWQVMKVPQGKVDEFLKKFGESSEVVAVEPDQILTVQGTPNDPQYPSQWYLPKIQAPLAWNITQGSSSRTIAVIDTGVDLNHVEFAGKIVPGYDFVNNDTVAQDDQGHGTAVAGVAAAAGNNLSHVAGVDWNAKIMPVKVFGATGSGTTSNVISGLNWAATHGAHVINLSLGGGAYSQAFQDAINSAWNSGKIIVASAGGSATTTKSYPAGYTNVIAVAATDQNDALAGFSDYGTWIDIAAPGTSITALRLGGGTATMSGTSYSAAIVSGVMSLTWSKRLTATNSVIANRVLTTADKIAGTGTKFMNGRVNAYNAVNGF